VSIIPDISENIKLLRNVSLQEAFLGKLKTQNPKDEPVKLLNRINDRKERILKEKYINTDIKNDLNLYYIPDTWKLANYEEVTKRITYGFTNPMPHVSNGPYIITAKNVINNSINYDSAYKTDIDSYNDKITEKCKPDLGDVLITKDATLGRVAIVDKTDICVNQSVAVLKPDYSIVTSQYLAYSLLTPYLQKKIINEARSTTIKHLQITKLAKWKLTLPPIAEQQRIVEKINQLMKLCDKLMEINSENKESSKLLMEATLRETFSKN
jgi:type I restriction enzyme S subunit